MYKVLIADESQEYIDKINKAVYQKLTNMDVCAETKTGLETIEMIKKYQPDIVVVSILLEGLTGIEVIRWVYENGFNIYIIVISEFTEFDFVKDAFLYGASNYLVKPLETNEIIRELERAENEIKRKEYLNDKSNRSVRKENQLFKFVEYSFIYAFLWNGDNRLELKKYMTALKLKPYGYIMNLEIKKNVFNQAANMEFQGDVLYQGVKDIISRKYHCVVGPGLNNRIIVYVCLDQQSLIEYNGTNELRMAYEIRTELKKQFDFDIRIGIGKPEKIAQIHDSYVQSLKALRYMGNYDVFRVQDIQEKVICYKSYKEVEKKLYQSIRLRKEECVECFLKLTDMLEVYSISERCNKLFEMVVMVCHELDQQFDNETDSTDYSGLAGDLIILDWFAMKKKARTIIEEIAKELSVSRNGRKSDAVKESLVYIYENYNKELTLDVVANYVGVTPQHFSKIFKEEMGSNYIDWLNNIRIDKAKEYLMQGNLTIREICFLVGLNDPNYFSRLFKKKTGKSPTEFVRYEKGHISSNHYK